MKPFFIFAEEKKLNFQNKKNFNNLKGKLRKNKVKKIENPFINSLKNIMMKTKKTFMVLLLILNCSSIFAQTPINDLEFKEFTFRKDTVYANIDENGEAIGVIDSCSSYIDLSILLIKSKNKTLQDQLNQFVSSHIGELPSEIDKLKSYYSSYVPLMEEKIIMKLNANTKNFVSLSIYSFYIECNANIASEMSFFFNYDIANDKEFKLEDIILKSEMENIELKCKKKLMNDYKKNDLDDYDFYLSHSFYLTDEKIVFYYPKYSIGCGAEGAFEVPILFSEISSSLTETFKKIINIK